MEAHPNENMKESVYLPPSIVRYDITALRHYPVFVALRQSNSSVDREN